MESRGNPGARDDSNDDSGRGTARLLHSGPKGVTGFRGVTQHKWVLRGGAPAGRVGWVDWVWGRCAWLTWQPHRPAAHSPLRRSLPAPLHPSAPPTNPPNPPTPLCLQAHQAL